MKKKDIMNLTLEQIEDFMRMNNEKPFRSKQVFQWLHKGVVDFDRMNNIPLELRETLKNSFYIGTVKQLKKLESSDSSTIKYLYSLIDHNIIECVIMKYTYGNTLCLSTQIGCRMGCAFCASTKGGLVRNLTSGEMLAQVLCVNADLGENTHRSIRNIVLMGSGEPLDNYVETTRFLRQIHHPYGLNISYRNITLSTCGIVPKILMLAEEGIPVTLSISLHAPNDTMRKKIMPIASKYKIADIINSSMHYFQKTGRRITFEYSLIQGFNDHEDHALELAEKIRDFPCHVNVIPINEIKETGFKRSSDNVIRHFISILVKHGIQVTKRRELGLDIQGACGQLRWSYLKDDPS